MKLLNLFLSILFFGITVGCSPQTQQNTTGTSEEKPQESDRTYQLVAKKANTLPVIDGSSEDECWKNAEWHQLDQVWLGEALGENDFAGRYKVAWSEDYLFLLAEIQDDTLIDIHEDPKEFYWDDDCLEIFIDENHSGGNHQYSHNAFAYHIGLDYYVADIGPDTLVHDYSQHIETKRVRDGKTYIWECAIKIYNDTYQDEQSDNEVVKLQPNKLMGFMLAYCDNDHSPNRENFIGSVPVEGTDKNRGWIDAGVFGSLTLVE